MQTFLTVKEAAQRTGKSPSSIRRILYPIVERPDHPDRIHVQPTVEEVAALRAKGDNFAWRVSEELLRRAIPEDANAGKGTMPAPKPGGSNEGVLIAMLQRELEIKNQQITQHGEAMAKQADLLSSLSERLREGNILIASLQQRLALTDGRDTAPAAAPAAKPKRTPAAEKGSGSSTKSPKAKRGFFGWLHRS